MNKITYCLFLFSVFGFSQNITFSDPDLLTYLTTRLCVDTDGDGVFESNADFNNDDQIQLSEAQQVLHFKFNTLAHNIEDIGGFENFSNLISLEVTTIDILHLDLTPWQSLQSLRLSSSIESFVFNNPALTEFRLQNVGFSNPLFDLTNLPNLEYVRVQSSHLTDNLIFGTHNNLEELRISDGNYSTLNLTGMPALKYLTIDEFVGTNLDISNNTLLEEFIFRYTDNLLTLQGSDASPHLTTIDFIQEDYYNNVPSNLDLAFNNQSLTSIEIRGVNSFSLNNNTAAIGEIELWHINQALTIDNCNFTYIDGSLNNSVYVGVINSDEITLTNIEGLRVLSFQELSTSVPFDLSTVEVENVIMSSSNLTELNLKNGDRLNHFSSSYDSNIQFICVDSNEQTVVEDGIDNIENPPVIHPYCSFVLGGDYYEINGNILVDLGTGCLPYNAGSIFDVQFTVTDNTHSDTFYTNNLNEYFYTLPQGNHVLTAQLVESDYWTIDLSSINLSFPSNPSPYTQDFCISPNGVRNDLEVVIIPQEDARPGFEADYKIIYKNKGNTMLSGNITFTFDDNYMDLLSANPTVNSQSEGNLAWTYSSLQPFETREIDVTMILHTPNDPNFPLNAGDFINYTATINPTVSDETPDDNTTSLNQEMVNSFDPNDKTCLEGELISESHVGSYVHYLIRFENTGTANAVNVVVKDIIDTTKYDLTSLLPMRASHDFYTRIINGNEVEFIFENIQLPFGDANNDGYVLLKIKTLQTLVAGDSFSNKADIHFDYNSPIVTNNAVTVVEENLGLEDFDLTNSLKLYPNPADDYFKIDSPQGLTLQFVTIYDVTGKSVKHFEPSDHYDVSQLEAGVYFVKVTSNAGEANIKMLKH